MDEEWRLSALCHKRNNNLWFPPMEAEAPEQYYSIAREVCRCCPLWEPCLEDAKAEKWGMWGGLTPKERNTTKQSALKAHGSWIRYRQGCRCDDCNAGHKDSSENVNVNLAVIPYMHEPLPDLSSIRFGLLY